MATNDPSSRPSGGALNSPAVTSPNGITEGRENAGTSLPPATSGPPETARREDETPGEKIGRFFRRAMDRLSGRDEEWRRGDERYRRDPLAQERSRAEDARRQSGRPAGASRDPDEWSDVGRPRDDRSLSDRSETGGSYGRFRGGSGGIGGEPSTTGRTYPRPGTEERHGGRPIGQGPSFENRGGRQPLGQGALGRSPGESYGLPDVSADHRQLGPERGVQAEQARDDWSRSDLNRGDWNRGDWARDQNRGEWNRERLGDWSAHGGASGMPHGQAGSGGSFGFVREEVRTGDWGEMERDRDRGQGRRFWQREPLAARDVMTRNPKTVTRQSAVREASVIMRDENCGVVPVADGAGRLEGILTDRDIAVRGVVHESFTQLRVEDVMTDDVSAVTEDEPLTSVLDLMGIKQIRRVPVVDRDDRLLGIISMADIANRADYDEDLQDAFERISSRRSFWSLFS